MSLKDLIQRGGDWKPSRVCWYAWEKFGKTRLACAAPKPLFIGNDDGRERLPVDGLPQAENWRDFVAQLETVAAEAKAGGYKTVVTDTINGIVDLCAEHICETQFGGKWNDPKHGFLSWGGSQGWSAVSEEIKRLLPLYDKLIEDGIWVILIAHSDVQNVKDPLAGTYHRFAPAMDRRVWARFFGWLDVILRGDYDISFREESGQRLAVGGDKKIWRCGGSVAESSGCNVGYSLPSVIPYDDPQSCWQILYDHLGENASSVYDELRKLWGTMDKAKTAKAIEFLKCDIDNIEDAPIDKVRALLNRLQGD